MQRAVCRARSTISPPNVKIIAVEGIIGAGKSTLLHNWKKNTSQKNALIVPEDIASWKNVRFWNKPGAVDDEIGYPYTSNGINRINGINGINGVNGFNGINGFNSINGVNGINLNKNHIIQNHSAEDDKYNLLAQMYADGSRWCFTFQVLVYSYLSLLFHFLVMAKETRNFWKIRVFSQEIFSAFSTEIKGK
ncbi:hypothetical protein RFI_09099 [Reticulomyxa filosa]|uniref:Uncharacterized protein n=1 Tax=Reticulomyxa filosa TaxID=46433 RepID=X6NQQ1_RETFI|nr:hypothetical protein RFI_09099 [Reticulomyxa filosa]|eukprot:ETO28029.1 hypothetical protein RFI_09099 [Reticulomyxa filosa]